MKVPLGINMRLFIAIFITLKSVDSKTAAEDLPVEQRLESLEANVEDLVTLVRSSTHGGQQVNVHLVELIQDLQELTTRLEPSHLNQQHQCKNELENCKAKLTREDELSGRSETTAVTSVPRSTYNEWTLSPTGCPCYWDQSRTDCACCVTGGCPCTREAPFWCVQCGDTAACTRLATKVKEAAGPYNVWTVTPTGCECYWDKSRSDCACCASGGCACPRETPYWCVKCADDAACQHMGTTVTEASGPYNKWTVSPSGCRCYWDKSRTDCACCAPGGCQCTQHTPFWCVRCGDDDACSSFRRVVTEASGPYNMWTVSPSGCRCYWDKSRTDCACCAPGGCQCTQHTPFWCVRCGDDDACSSFRRLVSSANSC